MYIKITNGVVGLYSIYQLKLDNPTTSFPANLTEELLAGYNVHSCTQAKMPPYDDLTEDCDPNEFVKGATGYIREWIITNKPMEEAERNIRSRRDGLLQDTDWIVIKSYERSANIPAEWELYRQALRDITVQTNFPYSVVWPTKP
tara:strand:- start:84 stop:518 length:435 start_codon:yes stop_codon:yes gene_type:complete